MLREPQHERKNTNEINTRPFVLSLACPEQSRRVEGLPESFSTASKDSTRCSPREDYAATVSRGATFARRDIIAAALRCKIFARASSPICASASALLVHSQPNSVPSVPHTMRSAPYKRTAASIARGPNELQSTYTFARRKRDDGSSSVAVSSRER